MTDARKIWSLDRPFFCLCDRVELARRMLCTLLSVIWDVLCTGHFKQGGDRLQRGHVSIWWFLKIPTTLELIFHIHHLMANFRKLSRSSQKFFKAHPTNLSYDAWNIRPWYSWKSYIHQYLETRTTIMPFQMRKKENRPFASKPLNWSLYLKAAELVLLFQSRRIALVGSSATKYRLF